MSTRALPFNGLPMDCWFMILDYLQPSDLNSLSKVCRSMHENTKPHLYRNLIWNWNRNPLRRLLNLFRTVEAHPELLALIQRVDFTVPLEDSRLFSSHTRANESLINSPRGYRSAYLFCQQILERSNMPDISGWKHNMQRGDPYLFATLLISQLPNLRRLSLDCSFVIYSGWPGMMLKHAMLTAPAGTLSKFEHLSWIEYGVTSARIRPNYDAVYNPFHDPHVRRQHNPYQFTGFFFLPALQALSLWMGSPILTQEISKANKMRENTMKNILSFHVEGGHMNTYDMKFLLMNMKNLRELSLGLSYTFPFEAWSSARAIEEGLKSIAPNLEKFSFRPSHLSYFSLALWYQSVHLEHLGVPASKLKFTPGFFKQFPKLVSLNVPAVYLTGGGYNRKSLAENLPSSLENLELRDQPLDMFWPERQWDELFGPVKEFFPP
ncbi:uncharacterized protein N7483_011476 [Penicillium malachiteum]|uniref:uncharacterized protein n=1 Tax=Penicillium malachiteum TaxID=1324776 RepID=UPI002549271B|nr:uncharacterized protein N7483_011476 [Penicillium malachiteum]KAJ5714295.1 hypothetical protein N7483_011476 [Penicillium malachiteum]